MSHKLGWSHYVELLKISNDTERAFYQQHCISSNWSVRELQRQKDSALFLRLASSKDKASILELAQKQQLTTQPEDLKRDSYVLEFLQISEQERYTEKTLEDAICAKLF